jgi:hypothetical protein
MVTSLLPDTNSRIFTNMAVEVKNHSIDDVETQRELPIVVSD